MIVGISGYARSGKDTLANQLVDHLGWERHGFADALRDVLYALNPIVQVEDGTIAVQHLVDLHGWEEAKDQCAGSMFGTRALLQRLGTDAGRRILGDTIWIDVLCAKLAGGADYVVPDVRFPNEADALRSRGALVIRIERPGYGPANTHPSETSMDAHPFDGLIVNDGTTADLLDQFRPHIQRAAA